VIENNNNHNNETINRNDAYIPSAAGISDMTVPRYHRVVNPYVA